jgi:hypothetical protein
MTHTQSSWCPGSSTCHLVEEGFGQLLWENLRAVMGKRASGELAGLLGQSEHLI